jgi:hypothetical protein
MTNVLIAPLSRKLQVVIIASMSLESLLGLWRNDPDTAPNISTCRTTPAHPAKILPFPTDLPAEIASGLITHGITSLYGRQAEAGCIWSIIQLKLAALLQNGA